MRKARLIGVAVSAAVALILVATPPAGAAISQNQAWHGGRAMYDNYGNGPLCTSGPTFVGLTYGRYYKAMPRHCYELSYGSGWGAGWPFAGIYEGDPANLHDNNCCALPRAGTAYEFMDVALVLLGTSAPARSKLDFNFCNGADCSSYYGGGSANPNWAGSWFTRYGWIAHPTSSQAWTKSGMRSGTSWTTNPAVSYVSKSYTGYSFNAYKVQNFGQCGLSDGDSGASLFYHQGGGLVYLAGMIVAADLPYAAGPGNGCYNTGRAFGTTAYVIGVDQIQAAFAHLEPGGIAPYF